MFAVHDIGYATLAALAVDPDDILVSAAHVAWIDGQVGNFPGIPFLIEVETLLDGILVAAREGGIDQAAGIGLAWMHVDLGAGLDHRGDAIHVAEIQFWIDAL